jgi:NAD(P)H-hydrate epimerase
MNAVVTAEEMAALDAATIQQLNIPGLILMENAGRGIAEIALEMLENPSGKIVHIYCGAGNNGGDGYVVARHLLNHGAIVKTCVLTTRENIKGDAQTNLNALIGMGHQPLFMDRIPELNEKPDLVVDALLGTGVKGALRGLYADVVMHINNLQTAVLAVDIPTGVNADTGKVDGPAINATRTATMALAKRGLLFSPGREHTGQLDVIDISMPPHVVEDNHPHVYLVDKNFIQSILPQRSPDAYKNKVGMIQVVAGSTGITGAAALASTAVLRTGAGLCYLNIPKSLSPILESLSAEVITRPLDDQGAGIFVEGHAEAINAELQNRAALVLGPGIGATDKTIKLVHTLMKTNSLPLVLDADALNACASDLSLIKNYKGDLVITPHPGEMARLTGLSIKEITAQPIHIARQYAQEWQCSIILKGGPTVTALQDGRVYINSTGNAGMATAGSGDVLSGIIGGLIGQGLGTEDAAIAAVYLHGLSGDSAYNKFNVGLIAGDIVDHIPSSLRFLKEPA